jgi:hypothetical protein
MKQFIYETHILGDALCDKIMRIYDGSCADETNYKLEINMSNEYTSEIINIRCEILQTLNIGSKLYHEYLKGSKYAFNHLNSRFSTDKITIMHHTHMNNDDHTILPFDVNNMRYSVIFFIFFLNTVDDGEILISDKYKIKPEKGKLLLFPSEWFFQYKCLKPAVNSNRYTISGFLYADS